MVLKNVLPAIIVSFTMVLFYVASINKTKRDDFDNPILQVPKLYSLIGASTFVGGIGLIIFSLFFAIGSDKIIAFIPGLIAICTGLWLFAKGSISHIEITDSEIVEISIFGERKEIKWNEIEEIFFENVNLELTIKGSNNHITAPMHLVGFPELVAELERKTGKTRSQFGIPED